jgi:3-oxoacyl-(acyl-carrier-protein) synthase
LRRNGVILSEGAAVMMLEDDDHALKRSAEILAVIKGYANSFDPSPLFNSSPGKEGYRGVKGSKEGFPVEGKGLKNAITLALKDAYLNPEDIDCIFACANSTKGLDRMETNVIKDVFGKHAYNIPVSSIKSMVGESFSASGALSLAAAVGTIKKGFIPPTMNYKERDPECDLDYVPNTAREKDIKNVLVISSDPYGQNTAIVLSRYDT